MKDNQPRRRLETEGTGNSVPCQGFGAAPPRKEPMFLADQWQDYEVLDCGGGEKLERWVTCICAAPTRRPSGPRASVALAEGAGSIIIAAKRRRLVEFFTKLPDRWV